MFSVTLWVSLRVGAGGRLVRVILARGVASKPPESGSEACEAMESCSARSSTPRGLVVGLYCDERDTRGYRMKFTETGHKFDEQLHHRLKELIMMALPPPSLGQVRLFYGLEETFNAVAVVGMGTDCIGYNPVEEMDEMKETIRIAAAAGAKSLQELGIPKLYMDSFGHAESAAEGASMGVWLYQENRAEEKKVSVPKVELYDSSDYLGWQIGQEKASAQNLARHLMETPANILTPSAFALNAVEVLTKAGVNVEVKVKNWAKLRKLNAFLAVSGGSCQPPIFLEANYEGCQPDVAPVVLIGKGVTFDAGGVCEKNSIGLMRGDMCGAAVVVAAMRAISNLKIPINVRGLIPLCENMPGACAFKPGDIVEAQNGKTILVQTTSNEGHLILADALGYSANYNPRFVLDVGTLCEESGSALGTAAVAVFSNSNSLYDLMRIASIHTGDRVWRMPLWDHHKLEVSGSERSDVVNTSRSGEGGPCSAASFLEHFLPEGTDWIHLDCYGTLWESGVTSYLRRGMSGRPTRTVVEFLSQLGCAPTDEDETEEEQAKTAT